MISKGSPDLVELARRMVAIPSVSRSEAAMSGFVESWLRDNTDLEVVRVGENLVASSAGYDSDDGLIFAGHLDTVPPASRYPNSADGLVSGVGAVDMKGGLAVMLGLAARAHARPVRFVFYVAEEIAREFSGLLQVEATHAQLLAGEAAVLLEPTDGWVEAGCQGTAKLRATVGGKRAHTARPFMGKNAIHRSHGLLAWLDAYQAEEHLIDGCLYREALSAVSYRAGVAGNVVPDEALIDVNYRFAPRGRDVQALAEMLDLLASQLDAGHGDSVDLVDWAPSAPPNLTHPPIARLVAISRGVRAKAGWTDVAFFWERGIPACNFGPGDPLLAHTDGEQLTQNQLDEAFSCLSQLMDGA